MSQDAVKEEMKKKGLLHKSDEIKITPIFLRNFTEIVKFVSCGKEYCKFGKDTRQSFNAPLYAVSYYSVTVSISGYLEK